MEDRAIMSRREEIMDSAAQRRVSDRRQEDDEKARHRRHALWWFVLLFALPLIVELVVLFGRFRLPYETIWFRVTLALGWLVCGLLAIPIFFGEEKKSAVGVVFLFLLGYGSLLGSLVLPMIDGEPFGEHVLGFFSQTSGRSTDENRSGSASVGSMAANHSNGAAR